MEVIAFEQGIQSQDSVLIRCEPVVKFPLVARVVMIEASAWVYFVEQLQIRIRKMEKQVSAMLSASFDQPIILANTDEKDAHEMHVSGLQAEISLRVTEATSRFYLPGMVRLERFLTVGGIVVELSMYLSID